MSSGTKMRTDSSLNKQASRLIGRYESNGGRSRLTDEQDDAVIGGV